jgi:5-methyltetrahydrofolate--homocysteine methyltransferase
VRGANVLAGTDKDCMTWIKTYKDYKPGEHAAPAPVAVTAPAGDGAAAPAGRRRGGREARMARG